MSVNPYVFIVGCPRSGTTLLQRMLNNHPELAVANDTHFIPRAIAKVEQADPAVTTELVERVWSYHRFYRMGLTREDVRRAAEGSDVYSVFVSRLYDTFARRSGKPLAGEKTPDYGRHIPLLKTLFPEVKIVHIVRDGRDVALSTLEWATPQKGPGRWSLWAEQCVATCALWWRWQVEGVLKARAELGPDAICEVRYEELTAEPHAELQRVSHFLDIEYDQSMLHYHEGTAEKTGRTDKSGRSGDRSAKSRWLPPTPGLRDWRRDMAAHDVAVFEALVGDTLEAFGYPTGSNVADDAAEADADYGRRWWKACGRRPAKSRMTSTTDISARC